MARKTERRGEEDEMSKSGLEGELGWPGNMAPGPRNFFYFRLSSIRTCGNGALWSVWQRRAAQRLCAIGIPHTLVLNTLYFKLINICLFIDIN